MDLLHHGSSNLYVIVTILILQTSFFMQHGYGIADPEVVSRWINQLQEPMQPNLSVRDLVTLHRDLHSKLSVVARGYIMHEDKGVVSGLPNVWFFIEHTIYVKLTCHKNWRVNPIPLLRPSIVGHMDTAHILVVPAAENHLWGLLLHCLLAPLYQMCLICCPALNPLSFLNGSCQCSEGGITDTHIAY